MKKGHESHDVSTKRKRKREEKGNRGTGIMGSWETGPETGMGPRSRDADLRRRGVWFGCVFGIVEQWNSGTDTVGGGGPIGFVI